MAEPSITCISCNKTSYNPGDVQHRYCGNCHSEHQGSIIWRAESDTTVITGYVGAAQMFRITALEARRFTLGTARLSGIFYEQSGRYDTGPNAFSTADGAKEWASILMARLVRKMFFSSPPMGTSGGVPVTDELVEKLADQAEAGYDEAQLVARVRRVLADFDAELALVEQVKAAVEEIKQQTIEEGN